MSGAMSAEIFLEDRLKTKNFELDARENSAAVIQSLNEGKDFFSHSKKFKNFFFSEDVLDHLEFTLKGLGITRFIALTIPMPDVPIKSHVMRKSWNEIGLGRVATNCLGEKASLSANDVIISRSIASHRAFAVQKSQIPISKVDASVFFPFVNDEMSLISVPIQGLRPYQGVVLMLAPNELHAPEVLQQLDYFCNAAFEHLDALSCLLNDRPGSLSSRERKVVYLTSLGFTAKDISRELEISERTVNSHLINSSRKLASKNKFHTVIQAHLYGQISHAHSGNEVDS